MLDNKKGKVNGMKAKDIYKMWNGSINQTNYDFEMMYVLLTSHVIFLLGKC